MSDKSQSVECARCHARVLRLIDDLCPACLARQVRTGMDALLAPAAFSDELAPEIDGIEIRELLGTGGMGVVFRAVREATGEPLTVKVLPRGLPDDPERAERFRREAMALGVLDHPGIVRILGSGESLDGRLYLAMELVDGCDLRRLLRTGKLEPARALDIAEKVAAALVHAHERGIIHRDIKPGNILIGDRGIVKVADFGIARAISGDASSFTLTLTREAFGTPYYIAPEVSADASAASPASDVYALGVVLYEMLTGRVPMGHFSPVSREAGLDRRADAVIASALDDNPAARTRTMSAFRAALQNLQRRLKRRSANQRWQLAAALAVSLAAATTAGVWFTRRNLSGQRDPGFPSPSSATREHPWENSIGMKFVPVDGTDVLFSIWETRRRDYEVFVTDTGMMELEDSIDPTPMKMGTIRNGEVVFDSSSWTDPGFPQTGAHPVVGISMLSATQFCRWLTTRERALGRLARGQFYRLPSISEWDKAWNAGPPVAGNIAGTEVLAGGWPDTLPHAETSDPFPRTAPVGSFPPNAAGLFDLTGNVMECCLDILPPAPNQLRRNYRASLGIRGDSWRANDGRAGLSLEGRGHVRSFIRRSDAGFRVVLVPANESAE